MSKQTPISPLAPKSYPDAPHIEGVRFSTAAAGIRYRDRTDVMLALLDEGTQAAGVFTKSLCASAPVDWCRDKLAGGKARALIVNSGNANAFTGKSGDEQVALTGDIVSRSTNVSKDQIFMASTGVIGEPLDARKFEGVLEELKSKADFRRAVGCSKGHHDDRHISQNSNIPGQNWKSYCYDQWHGKGRWDDRPGHGNNAFFCFY